MTNIVLTNVVVRDKKTGAVVKDLEARETSRSLEDKKPQQKISSFDYQNVDQAAVLAEKNTVVRQGFDRGSAGPQPCSDSAAACAITG